MNSFEQKIYQLNEKLASMDAPNLPQVIPSTGNSGKQFISDLKQEHQNFIQDIEDRFRVVQEYLQKHLQFLLKVEVKEDERIHGKVREYESEMEKIRNLVVEEEEQNDKNLHRVECELHEDLQNTQQQFTSKCKQIMKEIEKQMSNLRKMTQNQKAQTNNSIASSSNSTYIKMQKDYLLKLNKIQKNEELKVKRMREVEKRLQKKINEIYNNIGNKVEEQKKKTESKYEKMRRLFTLVIDL